MSELPRGWTEASLKELVPSDAPIIYGILQPGPDVREGVSYIRPTEIVNDIIDVDSLRRTSTEIATRYRRSSLRSFDVVLSIVGTIGKVAVVPPQLEGANITQSSCRLRPDTSIVLPEALAWYLRSPIAISQFSDLSLGTAVPRLNLQDVREINFPLAPVAEQHRIVAKIDSLSSKSKRAREHLDHIPRLVEKYKQAILGNVFSARAMENWTKGLVANVVTEGVVGLVRSKSEQALAGTPYIRMGHYDMEGRWNDANLSYVGVTAGELQRYELRAGDVLFNTRNSFDLVGKVAIWPRSKAGYVYNNNLLRLRFANDVVPSFAKWLMMSPWFRAYLNTVKSATTSVCAIYQRSLMLGPFAYPALAEQHAVVRRIEHAFAWIDRLAAEATSARKLIDRLDQAVLAKAFRGELVPQDPNDEPASVLLERIRAEREAAPTAKPRRGRVQRS